MYGQNTSGYKVLSDLATVAEAHPIYLQVLRQGIKEEKKKNKNNRGLEQRTLGFYGY
jgi:hypothetical protein